jgi:glycosyltransferase involved in cell wall biosynthesis
MPSKTPNIVLVDARPLQKAFRNGTTRHALAVTHAVAKSLPDGCELALFTSTSQAQLSEEIRALATVEWRPALLDRVKVFVQTATLPDPLDPLVLDVHRAPWISQVSVFLDDIMGTYPSHFIGSEEDFWIHQLAIEKLRSSSVVLSLGESSQAEAKQIWSSLSDIEAKPMFVISSCVGGIPAQDDQTDRAATTQEFVVFGNQYPHKNIGLPASALAVLRRVVNPEVHFTFVSRWSPSTERELRKLADEPDERPREKGFPVRRNDLGNDRNVGRGMLASASDPRDDQLAAMVGSARAVIVPSLHEGFSLPVIEAIERAVPILLSRIPAHEELLPDGPWFFDPRSVQSFLDAFIQFENEGHNWAAVQAAGLSDRYNSSTLENTVSSAVSYCVSNETRRSTTGTPVGPVSREVNPVKAAELVARDRALIQSKSEFMWEAKGTPLQSVAPFNRQTLPHQDHADVIEIYSSSRSWRLGRMTTLPYRLIRDFVQRKRA